MSIGNPVRAVKGTLRQAQKVTKSGTKFPQRFTQVGRGIRLSFYFGVFTYDRSRSGRRSVGTRGPSLGRPGSRRGGRRRKTGVGRCKQFCWERYESTAANQVLMRACLSLSILCRKRGRREVFPPSLACCFFQFVPCNIPLWPGAGIKGGVAVRT